jgi:hypothetical protein
MRIEKRANQGMTRSRMADEQTERLQRGETLPVADGQDRRHDIESPHLQRRHGAG